MAFKIIFGKDSSRKEQRIIVYLWNDGKKLAQIFKISNCWRNHCRKILQKTKQKKPRVKKTIEVMDGVTVQKSKKEPFHFGLISPTGSYDGILITKSSLVALAEISHFYKKKNIVKHSKFARTYNDKVLSFWKKLFWSDETMINRMEPDCRMIVQSPKCETVNPRYTQRIIKQGRVRTMARREISWHSIGPLWNLMKKNETLSIFGHSKQQNGIRNF